MPQIPERKRVEKGLGWYTPHQGGCEMRDVCVCVCVKSCKCCHLLRCNMVQQVDVLQAVCYTSSRAEKSRIV